MSVGNVIERARFSDAKPISQLLAETPEMRIVGFYLQPGQEVPPHTSASRVLMTVLKGRGHMGTGAGVRPVGSGDWAACEPNEPHGFSADEEMVVLAVIAPSPSAAGATAAREQQTK